MIANIGKSTANSGSGVPTVEEIETTWEKIEFDLSDVLSGGTIDISHDPFDHTKFLMACILEQDNKVYEICVTPMSCDEYGWGAMLLCPTTDGSSEVVFLEIIAVEDGHIFSGDYRLQDEDGSFPSVSIRPYIYIKPQ